MASPLQSSRPFRRASCYRRSEVEGGTLYSKDPVAACGGEKDELGTQTPEPRLASVAVLPDDHAAVASASPGAVKAVVEGRGSGEEFESRVDDLGGTVDGVVAGYVGYGKFGCKQFSPAGLPPGRLTPEIEEALKQRTGDLGPAYDVLLVGFVGDDSRFTGRVALDYEEEGEAKDGLEPRRSAFEKQSAPSIAEPLSAPLRLTSAKAEDDALVFSLAPRGGGPLTLNAPLVHRDLLFASC